MKVEKHSEIRKQVESEKARAPSLLQQLEAHYLQRTLKEALGVCHAKLSEWDSAFLYLTQALDMV